MADRILAERLADVEAAEEHGAAHEHPALPSPAGRVSGSPPPDMNVPWAPGHRPDA